MAKTTTQGKLAGQKVAFVGKFTYYLDKYKGAWAKDAGASVVPNTGTFDYLVYGEGRGGKPPGDVAKIEKRLPSVVSLDLAAFAKLVLPDPTAFVAFVKKADPGYDYWDSFQALLHVAKAKLDLSGSDFRKTNLHAAKLEGVTLDEADFREANAEYTHFGQLRQANFDKATAKNVYLTDVEDCTFRGAVLHKAWMFYGTGNKVAGCDFTGAQMDRARAERGKFANCTFANADLSDAELDGTDFGACDFNKANLTRIHAHKAKFANAKFANAKLYRADLRDTSLKNADLRGADLREAVLSGADLTGASVAGADFAGAVLTGATIKGVDFSKAKNYTPPVVRTAGAKVKEFAKATTGAKDFSTSAEVDLGQGEHATLHLGVRQARGSTHLHASSRYYRDGNDSHDWITAPNFTQGLLNMADRWPNATLRLDTVQAKGSKTVRGPKLKALAVAAWAEAFGVTLATAEDLAAQKETQEAEALRQRDELMEQIRDKGANIWHMIDYRERRRYDLRGANLSGAKLTELDMTGRDDLRESRFTGSNLSSAKLWGSNFHSADFTKANLTHADLQYCKCEKASFVNANLKSADLRGTKLHGADFTGADLTGAKLEKAHFDEHTKFPTGFKIPDDMLWKGKGTRPGLRAVKAAAVGSMGFDAFFKGLAKKVDSSRIQKATAMLKAERFQLYADVTDANLVGVVKSQSSKELVYSCRLASDGQFCCGTQNLKPCGGLSGALCKHLLVLVVGLAKAGKLDSATVDGWVAASKAHKPVLDKDAMSETLLKYKGAEAGDLDWRPTETVPEDFYAM